MKLHVHKCGCDVVRNVSVDVDAGEICEYPDTCVRETFREAAHEGNLTAIAALPFLVAPLKVWANGTRIYLDDGCDRCNF